MARIESRTGNQRALPLWLFIATGVLIVLRIVATMTASREGAKNGDLVHWVPLESVAAATGEKPILYDFTAAWCGPCRQLETDVYRNPELAAQINARFTPVKIVDRLREDGANRRGVRELQQRFQVRAFPTVVIADGTGAAAARMEGFRGAGAFAQLLDSVH